VVSKGKQAIVKVFAPEIKNDWQKSDVQFNAYYFKRVVALAIIFKRTDEIIKNTRWYKEKHSYKANVVAYTMSILFDYIRKNHKGYTIDFMKIWNTQDIYKELRNVLTDLCEEVYEFITRPDRLTENVTEWCKKAECWNRAKTVRWNVSEEFIDSLVLESEVNQTADEEKKKQKIVNEIEDIKLIYAAGKEYWQTVLEWGTNRNLLSPMEKDILKLIINMDITGRVPSDKQAKIVLKTRHRLIENGMPMQF
jgi:hypothetical protein